MKAKVLVIFTGGTIGSVQKDGVRALRAPNAPDSPSPQGENPAAFALIEQYRQLHPDSGVEFITQTLEPPFLSENATVSCWNRLLGLLRTIDFASESAPSGVVITHGTDTLAYAAALLSVVLAHARMPVLLVSSSDPLKHPEANGHKNFANAIAFIQSKAGKTRGVFVPYSYNIRTTVIYRGEDITQAQPFLHRFGTYNGAGFGYMEDGIFHADNTADTTTPRHLPKLGHECGNENANKANLLDALTKLDNCVILLTPYVGLDYARINLDVGGIRAVLHGGYHSFTMCVDTDEEDKTSSAKWFFAQCAQRDIPLYFASFDDTRAVYDSVNAMRRLSFPTSSCQAVLQPEFILHSSIECAYAKLLVGHNIYKGKGLLPKQLREKLNLTLLSDKSRVDNSFCP